MRIKFDANGKIYTPGIIVTGQESSDTGFGGIHQRRVNISRQVVKLNKYSKYLGREATVTETMEANKIDRRIN